MNVPPDYTLDAVEAIVTHREVKIEGLLLTLKLLDWDLAERVPEYLVAHRGLGLPAAHGPATAARTAGNLRRGPAVGAPAQSSEGDVSPQGGSRGLIAARRIRHESARLNRIALARCPSAEQARHRQRCPGTVPSSADRRFGW